MARRWSFLFGIWELIKFAVSIGLLAKYWYPARENHGIVVVIYTIIIITQCSFEISIRILQLLRLFSDETLIVTGCLTLFQACEAIFGLISVCITRDYYHHFKPLYIWCCVWTSIGILHLILGFFLLNIFCVYYLFQYLFPSPREVKPLVEYNSRALVHTIYKQQRHFHKHYKTQFIARYDKLPFSIHIHNDMCPCCLVPLNPDYEEGVEMSMTKLVKVIQPDNISEEMSEEIPEDQRNKDKYCDNDDSINNNDGADNNTSNITVINNNNTESSNENPDQHVITIENTKALKKKDNKNSEILVLSCHHGMHSNCVLPSIKNRELISCPLCRGPIFVDCIVTCELSKYSISQCEPVTILCSSVKDIEYKNLPYDISITKAHTIPSVPFTLTSIRC